MVASIGYIQHSTGTARDSILHRLTVLLSNQYRHNSPAVITISPTPREHFLDRGNPFPPTSPFPISAARVLKGPVSYDGQADGMVSEWDIQGTRPFLIDASRRDETIDGRHRIL